MSRGFVSPTDQRWFDYLSGQPQLDEVNFWLPNPWGGRFRVLSPGEPLFFKLKAPLNHIAGFGRFSYYTDLTIEDAWQTFGIMNGAPSLDVLRHYIGDLRRSAGGRSSDPVIGCIVLSEPSFWPRESWFSAPADFKVQSVRGRGYDLRSGTGASLWSAALTRLGYPGARSDSTRTVVPGGFGDPLLTRPRVGQGAFRAMLLDAYDRRCAITRERALPVLQAAHIRPFSLTEQHSLKEAVLLRSDIHALFDAGYLTITTELRVQVSPRFVAQFGADSEYLRLDGIRIHVPGDTASQPGRAALEWHNQNRFRA